MAPVGTVWSRESLIGMTPFRGEVHCSETPPQEQTLVSAPFGNSHTPFLHQWG